MNTYPGGKNGSGTYQKIINQMPPHQVYIEPFLGSGAILRKKKPARLANIGIDIDGIVTSLFQGISKDTIILTANAFDFLEGCVLDLNKTLHDVGVRNDEYVDAFEVLIYCDPPYLMETRSCQRRLYRCELTTPEEHARLLDLLLRIPCRVILSGYPSALYDYKLYDWRRVSYYAMTHGGLAQEVLWINYPEPFELHEYTYLGADFRERERIKRKTARWCTRLAKMDQLERACLAQAIEKTMRRSSITKGGAAGQPRQT